MVLWCSSFCSVCIGNAPIHNKELTNRTYVPFTEVVSTLGHARVDILKVQGMLCVMACLALHMEHQHRSHVSSTFFHTSNGGFTTAVLWLLPCGLQGQSQP
jgi:hypothetical protein